MSIVRISDPRFAIKEEHAHCRAPDDLMEQATSLTQKTATEQTAEALFRHRTDAFSQKTSEGLSEEKQEELLSRLLLRQLTYTAGEQVAAELAAAMLGQVLALGDETSHDQVSGIADAILHQVDQAMTPEALLAKVAEQKTVEKTAAFAQMKLQKQAGESDRKGEDDRLGTETEEKAKAAQRVMLQAAKDKIKESLPEGTTEQVVNETLNRLTETANTQHRQERMTRAAEHVSVATAALREQKALREKALQLLQGLEESAELPNILSVEEKVDQLIAQAEEELRIAQKAIAQQTAILEIEDDEEARALITEANQLLAQFEQECLPAREALAAQKARLQEMPLYKAHQTITTTQLSKAEEALAQQKTLLTALASNASEEEVSRWFGQVKDKELEAITAINMLKSILQPLKTPSPSPCNEKADRLIAQGERLLVEAAQHTRAAREAIEALAQSDVKAALEDLVTTTDQVLGKPNETKEELKVNAPRPVGKPSPSPAPKKADPKPAKPSFFTSVKKYFSSIFEKISNACKRFVEAIKRFFGY